jgi:protein-S-isoprenylcysteine O-methyltransferase Ste14
MKRWLFFAFGVACHALFLATYAYLCGFVGGTVVPKSVDAPAGISPPLALTIDVALLGLFAVPHSVMARPAFKRWWTRFVPKPLERSVYVLVACASLIVLFAAWQPIGATVWDVRHPLGRAGLWLGFAVGWLLVPVVSLLLNHFDLFGTRQVWLHLRGRPYTPLPFHTPYLYRWVRHPLYVGWLIAFWSIPTMTAGHLLFAGVLTAYILIAIGHEERDLVDAYGEAYARYRKRVPMIVPRLRPTVAAAAAAGDRDAGMALASEEVAS